MSSFSTYQLPSAFMWGSKPCGLRARPDQLGLALRALPIPPSVAREDSYAICVLTSWDVFAFSFNPIKSRVLSATIARLFQRSGASHK